MTQPVTRLGRLLLDRGLVRPPSLQTDKTRSASKLELFFDLAFVLVVAELAKSLRGSITPGSVAMSAGLFIVIWWSWMGSTLYANRFDHDDVVFRLNKLTGMLAVLGMAASVSDATGKYATYFILSYVVLKLLLLAQYLRAYRHVPEARDGVRIYLIGTGAGIALWLASLTVEGPLRYVLWGAGILVEALAPVLVTVSRTQVPLHLEHLPERFSLFVILVLGESTAAIAHGVHDAGWKSGSVMAGAVCFVLTAALWWSWFQLAGAEAKDLLEEEGGTTSTLAHDAYVYGQLPLTLALAAVGAGAQGIVVEGISQSSAGPRTLVAGGVALYLLTTAATHAAMSRSARTGWLWAIPAAAVAVGSGFLEVPALLVIGVLTALLVGVVIAGHARAAHLEMELETT